MLPERALLRHAAIHTSCAGADLAQDKHIMIAEYYGNIQVGCRTDFQQQSCCPRALRCACVR